MKLKELIADLENREVEDVSVVGKHNKWVATCELRGLKKLLQIVILRKRILKSLASSGQRM